MVNAGIAAKWTSLAPYFQSTLRIMAAFSFMLHGTLKLFAFPGGENTVVLLSQRGLAGVLEVFGGALLMVGFMTRPVAFLLSGEMAVAYFQSHFPRSFWPVRNGGEPALLFCFIWLYFSAAGAGPWSLDQRLRSRTAGPN